MADQPTSTKTRTASCNCGSLKVTVTGEPGGVNICSCHGCQRTSGSAFSYTTFYPEARASIEGEAKEWVGKGDAGREMTTGFCPTCGSSVYRKLQVLPGVLGVFAGCFADPATPGPENWYHVTSRHAWLKPLEGVTDNETQ